MDWKNDGSYENTAGICEDIETPKDYQVIFLNDDYTTMEFVVEILIQIFRKTETEAELLMQAVHKQGAAAVGSYPYDLAETRASLAVQAARQRGFPFRCKVEEV